jgi:transcriptional regulator with XRE-family HTH domain
MHGIIEDSITSSASLTITRPPRRTRKRKAVRLSDVANRAGVSIATVSMVLNNNQRISAATRQRVRGIVRAMGYQPLTRLNPLVDAPALDSTPFASSAQIYFITGCEHLGGAFFSVQC